MRPNGLGDANAGDWAFNHASLYEAAPGMPMLRFPDGTSVPVSEIAHDAEGLALLQEMLAKNEKDLTTPRIMKKGV